MYIIGLPEDILSDSLRPVFKSQQWQNSSCTIVVDEGHCVVMWSEFRPKYEQIVQLRSILPESTVVVMTATASISMQTKISTALSLHAPKRVMASVDRRNIFISVQRLQRNRLTVEDMFVRCIQPLFVELERDRLLFAKTIL